MDQTTTLTTQPSTNNDQTHHDFMNVDSSQLPFIHPSPSSSGIRLFGIDFSSSNSGYCTQNTSSNSGYCTHDTTNYDQPKDDDNNSNNGSNNNNDNNNNSGENGDENGRKFECHYCCRNFPTSQALGGHQNAHKRERQHAKRAHLANPHHHYNRLLNYSSNHRTSLSNTTSRFSYQTYHPTTSNTHFYATTPSIFGNHNPHTINGNPLMWRMPTTVHSNHDQPKGFHRDHSFHTLPYFGGIRGSKLLQFDTSESQVVRPKNREHVSLDLGL